MAKIAVPSNLDPRLYTTLRQIVEQINKHQQSVVILEQKQIETEQAIELTPSTHTTDDSVRRPYSSEI